jgi:hypothetical protein
LASAMRLTMPNRSKVLRARRSIRVTVTTSPGRWHEAASVGRKSGAHSAFPRAWAYFRHAGLSP